MPLGNRGMSRLQFPPSSDFPRTPSYTARAAPRILGRSKRRLRISRNPLREPGLASVRLPSSAILELVACVSEWGLRKRRLQFPASQ